jgi:RNA polymerase sigma factor (TIGR02999 family)
LNQNSDRAITLMLRRWQSGDDKALDSMVPVVYEELQRLAARQLDRDYGATLQPTELVAEAYMQLVDVDRVDWKSRAHFYSMAARIMRRVLVQRYRRREAVRRGGGRTLLTLAPGHGAFDPQTLSLDALEQALGELERLDPRQAEIVTLKFFGGLTAKEIAQALDISEPTVKRDWAAARIWLYDVLSPSSQ